MKITAKLFLCFLLLGSSLACFAQKMPLKEGVNNIPAGRDILIQPQIKHPENIKGAIMVNFTLDKKGNVISAHSDEKGTTVKDMAFVQSVEKAVKEAKFSALKTAPAEQYGSLNFEFNGK